MSRIGKQPIKVPAGVTVNIAGRKVSVDGPKGNLSHQFPEGVKIAKEGDTVTITRDSDKKLHRAFHGMTRALLANMITGVKEPFSKIIEIYGTGFSCQVSGKTMDLDIGFSHKVKIDIPSGIEVKADGRNPVVVTFTGADKQAVGQLAAIVRAKRPPSPYGDNKGVRYRGEQIRKKAGKAFGDKK